MNNSAKQLLMRAVVSGTLDEIHHAYYDSNEVFCDESYFDYKLLQAALARKVRSIIIFLIEKIGCRPHNQNDKNDSGEAPLHTAFKAKHLNGEAPLYTVFKKKNIDLVRLLLDNCCKFNCVPKNKVDLLHSFHIACVTNHTLAAEHYLKYEVDPNKPIAFDFAEYSGLNPVHFAAENNYYELFEKLICHGADLSIKNAKGFTALHILYYSSPSEQRISQIKHAFKNGNETKFVNSVDNNGLSHFHLCCMTNEPDILQHFIDNGANVNSSVSLNCIADPGYSPLHFAVISGCEKVVQMLLKTGANCNTIEEEGKTPLHLACKISGYWKLQIMKMLIEYKANPVIIDKDGNTPLHMEFYYANSVNKCIFDVLSSKISRKVNYTNNEGLSYFHIACATNDVNQVNDFLNSGVNIDSTVTSGIYSGYTALHFAALHNRKDVVELLLKKNAQVNVKTTEFQITPLHLACEFNYMKFHEENAKFKLRNSNAFPINFRSTRNRRNQLDIIGLLLSYGAQADAKDSQGITPFLHTFLIDSNYYCKLNWSYSNTYPSLDFRFLIDEISFRLKAIIEIFQSKKANVEARTNTQQTILHIIAKYEMLNITENLMKLILTTGVDIDAVDVAGLTPLHVAVECSNKNLIDILLKYKANVNAKCKNFKIPLQLLIEKGVKYPDMREIFCTLLENGSNVNFSCTNKIQQHTAYDDECIFIIEKLLYYGADVNVKDSLVNSCFPTLLKWIYEGGGASCWYSVGRFVFLFQVIFIHVQKLLAINLRVCEQVKQCCDELCPYYVQMCSAYQLRSVGADLLDDCITELEEMKLIKIDKNTSLYNIIMKDAHNVLKYLKNSKLIKILTDKNVDKKFPLYSYLLKLQFRKGTIRSEILRPAKASLTNVFNLDLPDLCLDLIIKYLTNEEIANLNAAASLKLELKRKLTSIDANHLISSPKLQKSGNKSRKKKM